MSGKNRSCHFAGGSFMVPTLPMNTAVLNTFSGLQREGVVLVVDHREDVVERILRVVRDLEIGLRGRLLVLVDRVDRFLLGGEEGLVDLRIGVVEFAIVAITTSAEARPPRMS